MIKKKILLFSFEFPPVVGGAGIYANDLAIGLSKIGYEVKIITFKRLNNDLIIRNLNQNYNIKVIQIKRNIIFPFYFLYFFLFKTSSKKIDKIIISDLLSKKLFSYLGFLNKKLLKKSIVILHGNEMQTIYNNPNKLHQILRLKQFFRFLIRNVNKVVVASASEKEIWDNQFKFIHYKIVHINHGVNQDYFYKITVNNDLYNELELDENYKYILTVSRLTKEKGQDNVIKAFSLLHEKNLNYRLIIVGEGPYKDDLIKLAHELKVENKIIFKGEVKRQDLLKYYNISKFFTLISRYKEAFGLVYIEAAACGKASVSGNIGGVVNAVLDKQTGLNVNSNDIQSIYLAYLKLIENENLLNEFSNNAYQNYLINFTEINLAQKTIENNE